jgi:hypothetical protein
VSGFVDQNTPRPFRDIIYRRNKAKYNGDPLGPAYDPIKNADVAKTLSDTNALANGILYLPKRGLVSTGGAAGGLTGNYFGDDCECQ